MQQGLFYRKVYVETDGEKTLAVDISAAYHLLATTAANDQDIEKESGGGKTRNAVVLENTEHSLTVNTPISLWVGLPAGFTDQPSILVGHTKDGDTIIVSDPEAKATVSRALTVTLKGEDPDTETSGMLSAGGNYSMSAQAGSTGGTLFAFTQNQAPSSGAAAATYPVTVGGTKHGSVSADRSYASRDSKVTLTPKPDDGYMTGTVTVTDQNGRSIEVTDNGNGTYSFQMPAGAVTVHVTFVISCKKDETCPMRPFQDADRDAWYHDDIHYCVEHGLMIGTGKAAFSPGGDTTRAQIVTILWRMEGQPAGTDGVKFEDVPAGSWYSAAISWAAANGIVDGYGNGRFGPDDPISREQMAAILYRYADHRGYDVTGRADLSGYTDSGSVSGWAADAMRWAAAEGLILGIDSATLMPRGGADRAQAATILMRYCEEIVK